MSDAKSKFTCGMCGGEFDKGWTDSQAQSEAASKGIDVESAGLVCDDCYKKTSWANASKTRFSDAMFTYHEVESEFVSALLEAGFGEYVNISGDSYDNSIEFKEVDNDARLDDAQQRIVFDAGFSKAYVNHNDGWETHYHWHDKEFSPHRGWRRLKTDKGFEINYWPEGWGDPESGLHAEWIKTGYIVITAAK